MHTRSLPAKAGNDGYAGTFAATKEKEKSACKKRNFKIANSSFKEKCKKVFINWKSVFRQRRFSKKNIKNGFEKEIRQIRK